MPTNNRPQFVPNAIHYFLRQDYPEKELVIVDDGTESIAHLIPNHPQIRYIRLQKNLTLGSKRNFCVQESHGDLIMHWDDDDWMAPYRIEYQVEELLKNKAEVCGLQHMYFSRLDLKQCWLYSYPSTAKPWLAGNSLLYTKDFWRKGPFPDIQIASDTPFILSRKLKAYVALSNINFYVAAIHGKNTSPKHTSSKLWKKVSPKIIQNIVNEDWSTLRHQKTLTKRKNNTQVTVQKTASNTTKPKVSACLLSYKRPENIRLIVDQISKYPIFDEILIWHNNPEEPLQLEAPKVQVINAPVNSICYGRFQCAAQARNELIYVQDDDAIVENIPQLFQHFQQNDKVIVHALQKGHFAIREQYQHFYGTGALLGWGAFFKKKWLSKLHHFLETQKQDYLFQREADLIFTLLQQKQHHPILAKPRLLDTHSKPGIALYRDPQHNLFKALAVRKALAFNRGCNPHPLPPTWNVVIPCKNYGHFLEEAIQSVLHNMADYILTIIDDGSTDGTESIGKAYAEQYDFIHYYQFQESKGVSFARNYGIAAHPSLFVVLLDADDKIGPNFLSEAEKLLRKGYDIANPDAILFGTKQARWEVPDQVSLALQLKRNHIHTCAAFRRSYWLQVGGIDESMENWQDYEFWIRLVAAGARVKRLKGNHFYYRKHGFSKSTVSHNRQHHIYKYIKEKHQALYQYAHR